MALSQGVVECKQYIQKSIENKIRGSKRHFLRVLAALKEFMKILKELSGGMR